MQNWSRPIQINPDLEHPCLPVTWPEVPLTGSRGTGAQDSLRTSTLTKDSWEGNGGWQEHPLCGLEGSALSRMSPKGGALHTELINTFHSVGLVHHIPQSHWEPCKGKSPRPCPQVCFFLLSLSFTPPPPRIFHGMFSGMYKKNIIYQLIHLKQEKSSCLHLYILSDMPHCNTFQNVTQSLMVLLSTSSPWNNFLHSSTHMLLIFETLSVRENAWHEGIPHASSDK